MAKDWVKRQCSRLLRHRINCAVLRRPEYWSHLQLPRLQIGSNYRKAQRNAMQILRLNIFAYTTPDIATNDEAKFDLAKPDS
jgi:hypothetical protein